MLKKQKEKMKNEQQNDFQAEELTESLMDQVSGAGNPFDKIPRVPTQAIDDDLREKS